MDIKVTVKDPTKAQHLLLLLQDIPYIEVKVESPAEKIPADNPLDKLFGLWTDREISAKDLRRQAWNL